MTGTVRGTEPPEAPAATATATYVYAVCRGGDRSALSGLPGQAPGAPVRLLPFGGLAAVVQDVPAAEFGEDALRERLTDRTDLERCARAHHTVIAAAAATAPVLPLPLATIYRGDARARAALIADRDRFTAALRRITGRAEWGVKVYARPTGRRSAAAAHAPDSSDREREATRPGHAYLDRLRGVRHERERRQEAGVQAVEAVERAFAGLAVAGRQLRPHDTSLTEGRGAHLLNAAYLVGEARAGEVADAVRRLRRSPRCRDVEIELTGPWVPYSFVDEGVTGAGG
ncbi:GvpL/GvpF family gas vesicle protein [Streptomyces sp. WMMC500]|uniref:GvpL/GvpF family gas vesicle protein n=1 Tax=Streptomyces sp. WMMC500 TaxID=3015154 RepID=UPI00248BB4EC|nr:GvpL/GvpF family gas vesicle protein [Streptomyces sp. WMMC500]WBB62519.1 GvpL/GvpF family gas vesicle protein [Streptomyces sp. WMMC500]